MARIRKTGLEEVQMTEIYEVESRLEETEKKLEDAQFALPIDETEDESIGAIELIQGLRISKKLKEKVEKLFTPNRESIKMLVNLHYQMQDMRKALREQIRAIYPDYNEKQDYENNKDVSIANVFILDWLLKNFAIIEAGTSKFLELTCNSTEVGRWLIQIKGIGPALAAGCLAYFDVEGRQYASQFISYAGLNDNNRPWIGRKGAEGVAKEVFGDAKTITDEMVATFATKTQWKYSYFHEAYNENTGRWSKEKLIALASKVPYNKELKCLMWKIGKSFQYLCNKEDSLYGRIFSERRQLEMEKNERGEYAEQAYEAAKRVGKDTEAYKSYSIGKLPKAHLNARAMRYAEKIFISHLFEEMYRARYGKAPARYYILEKEGLHNKEIEPEVPYTK